MHYLSHVCRNTLAHAARGFFHIVACAFNTTYGDAPGAEKKSLYRLLGAGCEEVFKLGALRMGGHGGLYLQCKRQRIAALAGGDAGLAAVTH